jgi:hypothetical protein
LVGYEVGKRAYIDDEDIHGSFRWSGSFREVRYVCASSSTCIADFLDFHHHLLCLQAVRSTRRPLLPPSAVPSQHRAPLRYVSNLLPAPLDEVGGGTGQVEVELMKRSGVSRKA